MSNKCTPLWREAHFQVKMYRNTSRSDHFWKLRCRKSARCCGAKHISKSKCANTPAPDHCWDVQKVHTIVARGTFQSQNVLEVEMSNKCTPLRLKAHFEVKMLKTPGVQSTFGRSNVLSRGRCKGLWTLSKVSKTWRFCSIFNYNQHYTTLHSNTSHYNYNYTFTTFYYTTLHSTTLQYTQLHSITLNYTQLRSITLHYTTLHYTTLHYTTLHYTTLRCTTLDYIPLHYIQLRYATLHYTTPPYPTLHYITYITLHITALITPPHMQLQLHYTNYTTP